MNSKYPQKGKRRLGKLSQHMKRLKVRKRMNSAEKQEEIRTLHMETCMNEKTQEIKAEEQ